MICNTYLQKQQIQLPPILLYFSVIFNQIQVFRQLNVVYHIFLLKEHNTLKKEFDRSNTTLNYKYLQIRKNTLFRKCDNLKMVNNLTDTCCLLLGILGMLAQFLNQHGDKIFTIAEVEIIFNSRDD
ncbi:hypothetical protein EGR_05522 [Echinococcus granulosus]|uniref:Uncharacterized protein n=1 Tax=Echinococcus granulosus TaxID=6210 RepID=W6UEW7_ECHGR|nr:hypothetical protein EGR_05522 [Echinococcus granulosus]EUB59623.1 hypothetical protein EGR_05522 [Echinococcus granulosus]